MHPSTPTPPHFPEPRWEFTKRMELTRTTPPPEGACGGARPALLLRSPFSVEAVELLEQVGNPLYKVASGEVTNPPLLEAVAATGSPCSSRPGCPGSRTSSAPAILQRRRSASPRPAVHLELPGAARKVNLRAMAAMASASASRTGSPTTRPTSTPPVAAVALGASAIEKHFTSRSARRSRPSRVADARRSSRASSRASARPRRRSAAGQKERDPGLDPAGRPSRRASSGEVAIPAGTEIEREMLTMKRPGNGIPAVRLHEVVGRKAARDIPQNTWSRRATLPAKKVCVVVASRANYARVKTC